MSTCSETVSIWVRRCEKDTFHGELNGANTLGFSYVDNDGLTVQSAGGTVKKVQRMRYGTMSADLLPVP